VRQGNLFVISGPSGAGKGTLVALLLQNVSDAWCSISATTRKPREGEIDGTHYYFVSSEEFERMIRADEFLEWAQYSAQYYGTPKKTVEEHMARGEQVILEIDMQGAFQIREKMPEAHLIFIEPPSLEILRERLVGRGTESEEDVARRMAAAEVELSHKMEYDYRLVNDDLERAQAELCGYVNAFAQGD